MNDESQRQGFGIWQGMGIFVLLLLVEIIVGGICMAVFGFHLMVILTETLVLLVPFSFLPAGGYSFRRFFSYPDRLGTGFWILVAAATLFLSLVISDVTGYLHQLLPRPKEQQEALVKLLVASSWPEYLFRILAGGALAGFCEEFAFRGFFQSVFSKKLGGTGGFFLSAFLFGLMHLDPWMMAGAFMIGLFCGYLVYLTGNLWTAIFVHAFANTLSFSAGFFSPKFGSDFEFTFPPYVTLICTVFFILSIDLIRKAHSKRQTTEYRMTNV
ncbi:MAG: type II CAAX endopeptidase family protein [Candidatus Zixiibacteriota bacterium]